MLLNPEIEPQYTYQEFYLNLSALKQLNKSVSNPEPLPYFTDKQVVLKAD